MSKNAVVTYKSLTGYTKQYAQWISEELDCDLFDVKDVRTEMLERYEVIIYGGGLYAGGVSGMKQLIKLYPAIREKELILFTCGVANTEDQKNVKHIEDGIAKVIPAEMNSQMKQFHFRGGLDYKKMSFIHRMMMWMVCRKVKKNGYENLSGDDKLMVDTFGKQVDFSDRGTIFPLITYISSATVG